MCAARHPRLGGHAVRGVLLIDSPVLGGWRARMAMIEGSHLFPMEQPLDTAAAIDQVLVALSAPTRR